MAASEELREALLTAERLRARAERRQLEQEALLDGLSRILEATSPEALIRDTFGCFRRVLDFDDGFILEPAEHGMVCVGASHPRFYGTTWSIGKLLRRVLDGTAVTTFTIDTSEEWQAQAEPVRAEVASALYAPVQLDRGHGVVVLVSCRNRAFKKSHAKLLEKFSVLAAQALTTVNARGLQAENEALDDARRRAEEASAAKSAFLATVSHELRTPLTGIFGMLDVMSSTPLEERQQHFLRTMRSSAEALRRLVDDVLDYSKIEAKALSLDDEDFSPQRVLKEVIRLCEPTKKPGVGLVIEGASGEDFVRGDATRFRQIVRNLVGNALKFTEVGWVEVHLEIERHDHGFDVRVIVRDTGLGIPANRKASLFRPFEQVDGSIVRRFGGAGLGLPISQHLAQAMGGGIEVVSTVGVGSTFTAHLHFDVGQSDEAASSLGHPVLDPDQAPPSESHEGPRVLVVDDNAINREVFREALDGLGYDVSTVEDGYQALAFLERQAPDVILMDCHMPGMDGPSTTRALRAMAGRNGRIPVIAVTADVMDETRVAFEKCDIQGFVTKPIDWGQLLGVLERSLASSV